MMFTFGAMVGFSVVSVLVFVLAAAYRENKAQAKKHFELFERNVANGSVIARYSIVQNATLNRIAAALESRNKTHSGTDTVLGPAKNRDPETADIT